MKQQSGQLHSMMPRKHPYSAAALLRRGLLAVFGLCLCALALPAQQQFQGWCARVKIEIEQELALERVGFEATLTVTNNDGEDAITDFLAQLTFEDPDNPGEDASDLFFVRQPQIESTNAVDGTGVIQPTRTAVVRWFIIPKIEAGGEDPRGKEYNVGARLSGKLGGVEIPKDNMLVIPDDITVRPEPQLDITYFLPRDVRADNPFTEEVEAPVPFTLGVLVSNDGFGPARDLEIDSQQPEIVEDKQGLRIVAQLLGARVMDSELDRASLLVDLGDLQPGETKKGAWDMITSLSGEFIDFNASYTHDSDLGGEETSLINSLEAHFFVREVLNDQDGRDRILDFLAVTDENEELIPDALYESEGNVLPVNHLTRTEVLNDDLSSDLEFLLRVEANVDGWGYVRIDDPAQGKYPIQGVTRSDGKEIHPRNAWTDFRYEQPSNRRLDRLHVLDLVETGRTYEYTVTYEAPVEDTTPPETEIAFAGDHTRVENTVYVTRETEIFFLAEDESPVSILYKLDDADSFIPGVPFQLPGPGTFTVTYFSRDAAGNEEAEKTQVVVLSEAPPVFDFAETEEVQLVQAGETLSVRASETELAVDLSPSPFPVSGDVSIHRGVVAWPRVSGVPPSPTGSAEAGLTVSGKHVDFYRYRLNGGEWSAEASAGDPIALSGLSGDVELEIIARSQYGTYGGAGMDPGNVPEEFIRSVGWTVSPGEPAFSLDGLPPVPLRETAAEIFVSAPDLELYRWTLDGSFFRPEEAPTVPIDLDPIAIGERTLDLVGRFNGTWQDTASPSRLSFTVDPMYGADLSALPEVRSIDLGELGGTDVSVTWDGLDDNQRPVPSGWYTVKFVVADELGRSRYRTRLIEVRNIADAPEVLASAETGPDRPHARGDWVVWQDRADGPWNIRARDLSAPGASVRAITDGSRDQTRPHTDGRHVVWQGRNSAGTWDVWSFDLEAGSAAPVRLTDSGSRNQSRPIVAGPWVVWRERVVGDADAPWQLVARNPDTGETSAVFPGPADQREASIQGGRVVWRDERDVGPGEIYYADLETGETGRLTERTDGQFHPAIFGDWVVWQDTREGVLDIFGYDFLRSGEVRLSETPENEAQPYLDGYWMVTEEDGAGVDTTNFRLRHLEAGASAPLTNAPTDKAFPGIAGGHFVWLETTGAGPELRAARLPALQAAFADNNAIVVTGDLANRFTSAFPLLETWKDAAGIEAVGRYASLVPEPVRETAVWDGGAASGDDFALQAGDFLWVRFGDERLVDLGTAAGGPVDLAAGTNVLSYVGFPSGYHVRRLVEQLGTGKVAAVRRLDSRNGRWLAVTVENNEIVGPDFAIPETALLFIEMKEAVGGWKPE